MDGEVKLLPLVMHLPQTVHGERLTVARSRIYSSSCNSTILSDDTSQRAFILNLLDSDK
jgi:hypothetical protein